MTKTFIKLTTLSLLSLLIFCLTSCKKDSTLTNENSSAQNFVPQSFAKTMAEKFKPDLFLNKTNANKNATQTFSASDHTITSELIFNDHTGTPAFYLFNYADNKGFLFVSADWRMSPVLAYIDNGTFDKNKLPEGLQDWLNRTTENTEVLRKGLYDNSKAAAASWNDYIKEYDVPVPPVVQKTIPAAPNPCDANPNGYSTSVTTGPWLPTTWGQACTYNDLCALNQNFNCTNLGCGTGRPLTGCVATSISQIIRYHQFPANYNYGSMPASSGNTAVQQLMRDAGNSVSMQYGCSASGAYGADVVPALKNVFNYSSANRVAYTGAEQNNLVNNIYQHRPVLLEGRDLNLNSGHEWVCDGVITTYVTYCIPDNSYNTGYTGYMFHMNWGFHEVNYPSDYNGWYSNNDWSIYGLNYHFNYANYMVRDIHP